MISVTPRSHLNKRVESVISNYNMSPDVMAEKWGEGEWADEVDTYSFYYNGFHFTIFRNVVSGSLYPFTSIGEEDDDPLYEPIVKAMETSSEIRSFQDASVTIATMPLRIPKGQRDKLKRMLWQIESLNWISGIIMGYPIFKTDPFSFSLSVPASASFPSLKKTAYRNIKYNIKSCMALADGLKYIRKHL